MFAERVPDLQGIPTDLTALLRRGMANNPAARPTAAELRDELAGFHRDPDPTMVMGIPVQNPHPKPAEPFTISPPTGPPPVTRPRVDEDPTIRQD